MLRGKISYSQTKWIRFDSVVIFRVSVVSALRYVWMIIQIIRCITYCCCSLTIIAIILANL